MKVVPPMPAKKNTSKKKSANATPEKRRPGRPRSFSDRSSRVNVRLEPEEADALREFAEEHYWTISTALRLLVRERLLNAKLPR